MVVLNIIQNLRETRSELYKKYQKGIITSSELHLLDTINNSVRDISKDIKQQSK